MSLRHRLYRVVGALVLVPLLVLGALAVVIFRQAVDEQWGVALDAASSSVAGVLADACRQAGLAARMVALEATTSTPDKAVARAVNGEYAEYAAVLGRGGRRLAQQGPPPGAVEPSTVPVCSGGAVGRAEPPVVAERVTVSAPNDPRLRLAVTATALDRDYLRRLRGRLGLAAELVLVNGPVVLSTTLEPEPAKEVAAQADAAGLVGGGASPQGAKRLGDWLVDVRPAVEGQPWTVIAASPAPGVGDVVKAVLAGILLAGVVVAVFAGALARTLTRPLLELTAAAERVAQGDLDTTIPVRSGDEVGRLASAFNRMTGELDSYLTELKRSRDSMRESIERLGETLESTHDQRGLLQLVLETAVTMTDARAGVAYAAESASVLTLAASTGLDDLGFTATRRLPVATGILGTAAANGAAVRGTIGREPGQLRPAPGEPASGEVLAVPLRRGGRLLGVLALFERVDGTPFGSREEETIRTLAGQAGIALDNVQLHREAQRLSTTDPLTGLWNFRYLSMSLAREIERASRFNRPLAVLMLDIDHFKRINDTYGHARGDEVLRELASRLAEEIREVDVLARYGGEEFVLVLPETGEHGAVTLAERICTAVRRQPFTAGESTVPLRVTVSIGVATFPEHGHTPATLMRHADEALYAAKGEGRDRWRLATGEGVVGMRG